MSQGNAQDKPAGRQQYLQTTCSDEMSFFLIYIYWGFGFRVRRGLAWAHLQVIEVHAIVDGLPGDLPKDGVLAVQVVAAVQGDEELAAVGVGRSCIRARHQPPAAQHALMHSAMHAMSSTEQKSQTSRYLLYAISPLA